MLLLVRDLLHERVLIDRAGQVAEHVAGWESLHAHQHRHRRCVLLAEALANVGKAVHRRQPHAAGHERGDVGVVCERGAVQVGLDRLGDVVLVSECVAVDVSPDTNLGEQIDPLRLHGLGTLGVLRLQARRVVAAGMLEEPLRQPVAARIRVGHV